jgi:hypothetical protein
MKELPPFVWRTFAEGRVALSEEGAVATQITRGYDQDPLTTTGVELTEGKHHWEVELHSGGGIVDIACYLYFDLLHSLVLGVLIGISRPNLDPTGLYCGRVFTDGWFMDAADGAPCVSTCGNDKVYDDMAGGYEQGGIISYQVNALSLLRQSR